MIRKIHILSIIALISLLACEQSITNVYDNNYTLELSRDTVIFNVGGGQKSVEIKTNQEWWEYIDNDNETWYTVKDFHNANGYEMLTISTDSCTELSNRETFLTINAGNKYTTQLCIIQLGNSPYIHIDHTSITIDKDTAILDLDYVSNIDFDIENIPQWITFEKTKALKEGVIKLYVRKNETGTERTAELIFKQKDGDYTKKLNITQLSELSDYKPVDAESITGNKQIPITSASASSIGHDSDVQYMFDGNTETYFQTDWQESDNLEFNFTINSENDLLNYIIYYPSVEANAFSIKVAQVMVKKIGEDTFSNLKMVVFDQNKPTVIDLNSPLANIEEVKFKIITTFAESGTTPAASCAEVEFYTTSVLYDKIFTDRTYSQLFPNVFMEDILNINDVFYRNIAKHLYNGTYQTERILELDAIQQDRTKSKINNASLFEYATGIYFNTGDDVVVFCSEFTGSKPSLIVLNSTVKNEYSLIEGINKIKINNGGKVYVNNPSAVKIHIASGTVEDKININDINSILELESVDYNVIDIYTENSHIITPISFAKANTEKLTTFSSKIKLIIDAAKKFYGVNDGIYKVDSKLGFYINIENLDLETLVNLNNSELNAICQFDGKYNDEIFSVLEKIGNAYEPYINKLWGINEVSSKLFALSYFYENNQLSIVKSNNYYSTAIQDIIITNTSYTNVESQWSKVVPLWQLYHYLKNAQNINDYYAQMCNKVKEKTSLGTYTSELLNYTNEISENNFNDFFYKWNMGGSQSAEPQSASLAYYVEDNLSIYEEMGQLDPGKFYSRFKLLTSYKNLVAIEIYNAGFLAHVETYKAGNSYTITWDKYSTNMKIKVVGPTGESAEPTYY